MSKLAMERAKEIAALKRDIEELWAYVERLRTENAEFKADACRMEALERWNQGDCFCSLETSDTDGNIYLLLNDEDGEGKEYFAKTVREAIDAALEAEGKD